MKKTLGLALVVVLLAGGAAAWWYFRPKQVELALRVLNYAQPAHTFTLSADGHELGRFDAAASDLLVPGRPQRSLSAAMLPAFSAQALYPCGWHEAKAGFVAPTLEQLRAAYRQQRPLPLEVRVFVPTPQPQITDFTLWIDNQKRPTARVAIGQDERTVPADFAGSLNFPFQDCAQGRQVRLDGKVVAELPSDIRDPKEGEYTSASLGAGVEDKLAPSKSFLLDLSGAHCYLLAEHYYTRGGGTLVGWAPPASRSYRPAYLHRLPNTEIEFFLKPPSQNVTLPADQTIAGYPEELNSLQSVRCS